jgi:hypothetical protein
MSSSSLVFFFFSFLITSVCSGVYGTQIGDGLRLSLNKGIRLVWLEPKDERSLDQRDHVSCKISLLVLFSRLRNPICTERNLGSSSLSSTQLS